MSSATVPVQTVPSDDIRRLEEVAALGWPAPSTSRLGDWLLRAGEGWTGRANSVLPLGEPDLPLDEALASVLRWYASQGLPARFQVPLPLCTDLDEALDARGWRAYNPTLVRIADVAAVLAASPAHPELPAVALDREPSQEWLAAYHYRGGGKLPPVALRVMTAAADPIFAAMIVDGTVLGVARAVVDNDPAGAIWCGITALETVPAARRRGIGDHLLRAVIEWAADRGATRVYLQVMEDNVAAQAMYDRLGFGISHRYHYRTPP